MMCDIIEGEVPKNKIVQKGSDTLCIPLATMSARLRGIRGTSTKCLLEIGT